ncbi:MAG: GNAT family N-acetyltransferase [Candidatus Eisenbacteria bacterium]
MTTVSGAMPARFRTISAEVRAWDTHDPWSGDFAAIWTKALNASPHAHFALDLDFLKWEAARGQKARALLIEGGGRLGLTVQRWEARRWISGWPWRWQALMCDADPGSPMGMTAADAAWLHQSVALYCGRETFLCYLPHAPAPGVAGWAAGATVIQEIGHSDQDLYDSMEPSKRRLAKRARGQNFEIAVARGEEDFRAFYDLQQESKQRRGLPLGSTEEPAPGSGDAWREWELPWMWLLLARQDGKVVAGVGDGIRQGGAMQGRTAAALLEARRFGVTVLLGYEELRRGRDLGHRWFNFGGDTAFKREMSGRLGRRVRVFGWLGGGRGQRLIQMSEASFRRVRPALARWRRRIGLARGWTVVLVHGLAALAPLAAQQLAGL